MRIKNYHVDKKISHSYTDLETGLETKAYK